MDLVQGVAWQSSAPSSITTAPSGSLVNFAITSAPLTAGPPEVSMRPSFRCAGAAEKSGAISLTTPALTPASSSSAVRPLMVTLASSRLWTVS